jgi:hypothetical protein
MNPKHNGGKKLWLNVQNVELKFQSRRRHGKWLDAQTNKENECNWKSGFTNVPNATPPSAKSLAKRKSKHHHHTHHDYTLTSNFSFFKALSFITSNAL